ncbi:MAG: DUF1501 domain-containing protein [Pirellulales bacterium]
MNALHPIRMAATEQATRRHFLKESLGGLAALWCGVHSSASASPIDSARNPATPFAPRAAHLAPKAKRVIYLHMSGAPSQLELFEYKPELKALDGRDCPQQFLEGKRFAFIRGVPQLLGPVYPFRQVGEAGCWISDRLPHFQRIVDKVCFIRTMHSDQFNHAPAELLVHTGNQNLGYASIGSWATYGLGSENENLPGFVVLLSGGRFPSGGKSLWGPGFLPSVYQGVQCRSHGEPVLFLSNPAGISRELRGDMIDTLERINQRTFEEFGDPQTITRIAQYEMAFRMQMAATDAVDISQEPPHIHELYGTAPGQESFANNCLLARRLVERGVRFVQLFDWGWDSHGASADEALNAGFQDKCRQIDQATAALLIDLEQRGLLEDTLVVWGGEFGRTPMRENRGGQQMPFIGRDHHPDAFTIWLAGGGVKPGFSYGETDPIGYVPVANPVHVRDFHATLLQLLGLKHAQLTYSFRGLDEKLTGVKPARVLHEIMA